MQTHVMQTHAVPTASDFDSERLDSEAVESEAFADDVDVFDDAPSDDQSAMELEAMALLQREAQDFPMHAKLLLADLGNVSLSWAAQLIQAGVPTGILVQESYGPTGRPLISLREAAHAMQSRPAPLNVHEVIRAWNQRRGDVQNEQQNLQRRNEEKALASTHLPATHIPAAQIPATTEPTSRAASLQSGDRVYDPNAAAWQRWLDLGRARGWDKVVLT